jgi:restriction system protein
LSRRKSEDTFDVLRDLFLVAPWWVYPLVAAAAYLLLAYVVPPILKASSNPFIKIMEGGSRGFAPAAAVLVLIAGLAAGLQKFDGKIMLRHQKGLRTIHGLTWQEFERLIAAAYRNQGYGVVETRSGPDGGVDLILRKDGRVSVVQCKHWKSSTVGVAPVRELLGITHSTEYNGAHGIFVTFGNYTAEATRFAKENGIELIDKQQLWPMIRAAQSGGAAETSAEPEAAHVPCCPKCGVKMVVKTAKNGRNAGNDFWSCSRFPKCRGARNIP